MADIKNYLKEKEKRELKKGDYRDKIARHRLSNIYRLLLIIAIAMALVLVLYVQYTRHIYTSYDVINSVKHEAANEAVSMRLQDAILTYSKDGAHCTDSKGNVTWNQTFEMQDAKVDICNDAVAIGDYNGRSIYVSNSREILTEITTNLPIKDMTVAATGRVTAVLTDSSTTWINTYDSNGENKYSGVAHMNNSGYPASVSLSPNGDLLGVTYVYVDAGTVKTNVAFYNFGPVGANQSDYMVSVYTYTDLLVPFIKFANDDTCFAVGDSRVMIFKGGQKPESALEHLYDAEIKSVYSSDKYLGVVFDSDVNQYTYRMDVYDTSPNLVGSFYFDIDYTDIFFEDDSFVAYNEKECTIITLSGIEKFDGRFTKAVKLMTPAAGAYRYTLVTNDSLDTIQLK